jgi:hypothetical protein
VGELSELSAEEDFDWDDPADRARALEILGPVCYNAALLEHRRRSTVSIINRIAIRAVTSRFGQIFTVGDTGRAFAKLEDARAFARGINSSDPERAA